MSVAVGVIDVLSQGDESTLGDRKAVRRVTKSLDGASERLLIGVLHNPKGAPPVDLLF